MMLRSDLDKVHRCRSIRFTLNGKETTASYEPGMHLLEVLREECGVVSAKNGCAPEGACGCCLVMIDGTPGALLPAEAGADGRPRRRDARRASRGDAAVHERGVRARGRRPVRLLHSRASSSARHRSSSRARPTIAARSQRRSTAISAAAPATGASSTRSRPPARRAANGGQLPRTEPRRHSFFGEEFGLRRNPGVRRTATATARNGHGIGQSIVAPRRRWSRRSARSRSSTTCACPACCTARWC